ncbi:MCE family protein [Nocardioides sp.]|uniref:MCE family protein n=1 Tax=Nocardioides sp. TaxID=35761 RepID=UPI002734D0E3|nr:MCE family protein [Nocardioides sp.]MDP3894496.1 MCE family protein [Nocardioides sp.]
MKKFLVPAIVLTLVAAAVIVMFGNGDRKYLTVTFPRTVSVYEGSDVRVLGVAVGQIESVTPRGTGVEVRMSYDGDVDIPADAQAVIVAPSIVGDRFVQLTPVYSGGEVLADDAVLQAQGGTPLELDEIYASLDSLTVALGPDGANKEGALSALLRTTAENFGGQGETFNQTIRDFGKFSRTLDNNKEELFGAAEELQGFIGTLAENDDTVRDFNQSLAQVSDMLAGERDELSASLRNLAVAMSEVTTFVKENRDLLGKNIKGLNRVSKVLVKQRDAVDEILKVAPLALNNLGLTYNPQAGTLDTRANMGNTIHELENNPELLLCGIVAQADKSGEACNLIGQLFPRAATFADTEGWQPEQPFDLTLGGLVEVQP